MPNSSLVTPARARAALAALAASIAGLVAPAPASAAFDVIPHVDCQDVVPSEFGPRVLVRFGYTNPNAGAVFLDYGSDNILLEAPHFVEGMPTEFLPGRHDRAFTADYHTSQQQQRTWYLQGALATARFGDPAIPPCTTADVSVTMSAPATVRSGAELTYTIAVANAGPSSAEQVTLRNTLPYGTQFVRASTDRGSCTGPAPKTKGGTVTCALGTIAPSGAGGTQRIAIKVIARPDQGVITNTLNAASVTADPVPGNNTATVQTVVTKR